METKWEEISLQEFNGIPFLGFNKSFTSGVQLNLIGYIWGQICPNLSHNFPAMHKGLLFIAIACLFSLAVQLLPIISVPITGPSTGYSLYLLHYESYKYGVFGICDMNSTTCSNSSIGYPSKGNDFYKAIFLADLFEEDFGVIQLPSKVRYTISKLLVVHVVSFCFSGCLLITVIYLMVIYSYKDTVKLRLVEKFRRIPHKIRKSPRFSTLASHEELGPLAAKVIDPLTTITGSSTQNKLLRDDRSTRGTGILEESTAGGTSSIRDGHQQLGRQLRFFLPSQNEDIKRKSPPGKKKDITLYLNFILMFSLSLFVLSLLAFLSDILLFVPHLSYLGWLQFVPIISSAVIASMTCFMKRSITSRKYLNNTRVHENDDMRMRRRSSDEYLSYDDSDSDDGFFVYTNGFYSTYDNNEETHHRPRSTSTSNPWRRHTPRTDTTSPEQIELSEFDIADGNTNRNMNENSSSGSSPIDHPIIRSGS